MASQVIDTTQKFAGQSQERGALSLLMTATEPSLTGKSPDHLTNGPSLCMPLLRVYVHACCLGLVKSRPAASC